MRSITSVKNEEIKKITSLKLAKNRKKFGLFLAEGFRICKTLEEGQLNLAQVYFVKEEEENAKQITTNSNLLTLVTTHVIEKISSASTPCGLICVFEIPEQPDLKEISSGIVLAKVSDPGNMGTLIRTCAAMGHHTVVLVEACDPWSNKVVQASAGTIAKVNIFELSWQELQTAKNSIKTVALVVTGGNPPNSICLHNTLLIIGSEATGIPEEWVHDCDEKMSLPMPGETESLNAAVAGSIALYLASTK
ncbi:MAG: tRNA/rRNA methyltransferase [candidate division TM6 bacterium GW2011_GWF2_32_72]|nr:MAG: tRNA/rRNA methyltransferase [candidate division TM6 bacterium GW2011_GWF2_32_72]